MKRNLAVTVIIILHWWTMALDTELISLELHRVDCILISTCRNYCTYNDFMASLAWNKWHHNEHTLFGPRIGGIAVYGVTDGKIWFCNFIYNFFLRAWTWMQS